MTSVIPLLLVLGLVAVFALLAWVRELHKVVDSLGERLTELERKLKQPETAVTGAKGRSPAAPQPPPIPPELQTHRPPERS
ncbi:MAG TPA: hypothetical protein VGK72_01235, partial [Chthoniobacterales bacterium]